MQSSNQTLTPTLDEIKTLMIELFDHRVNMSKEVYRERPFGEVDRAWLPIRGQMLRFCSERFGPNALGLPVNRDEPGFYRFQSEFADPTFARFAFDPNAAWVGRGWMFRFKEENAAFEFKMRWRGITLESTR
jgi:hypothetical protein